MKSITTILAALALSSTLTFAADEKPAAEKPAAAGEKHDADAAFKALDTDKDGSVSLAEFKVGKKDATKAEARFKAKDKDGNGSLSLEEFKAKAAEGSEKKAEK